MKVSVILTVKNEQDNITALINSLIAQSRKPDELVIVDGYSTDQTFKILQDFEKNNSFIRLLRKQGNIAMGRNFAISNASNQVIAQTDAGCIADKKWLERITRPFDDRTVDVVAGFYDMTKKSYFQIALAPIVGVTQLKFDHHNFMPSGRSIAFKKSVWKEAGMYPEQLDWGGEDTLFNFLMISNNAKFVRVPSAYVHWEVPKTFFDSLKKFYKYSIGDAQSGIWWHPSKKLFTHNIKILTIYIRYIILFFLSLAGIFSEFYFRTMIFYVLLYIFWSIWKHHREVRPLPSRLWLPIIQIGSDFAVMSGFAIGMKKGTNKLAKKELQLK